MCIRDSDYIFQAKNSGARRSDGAFVDLDEGLGFGYYWSSSEASLVNALYYGIGVNFLGGGVEREFGEKTLALSCRCIKK